jgi:hypothetical protein
MFGIEEENWFYHVYCTMLFWIRQVPEMARTMGKAMAQLNATNFKEKSRKLR